MLDFLTAYWPIILIALVGLVCLSVVCYAAYVTQDVSRTVESLLGMAEDKKPRIWYGPWGLPQFIPWTMGRARSIRITVPVRDVPAIKDMEKANQKATELRDALSMGGAESLPVKHRRRTWILTR
ncbi:hypothetical protein [Bifidobacterium primatium]|nr:hypothetical protein [Bifidobacterium primatium]